MKKVQEQRPLEIQTGETKVSRKKKIEIEPEKQFVTDQDLINEGIEIGRIQGIAYMTAELSRWGGPDANVVKECRENDVSEYDLEILEKYEHVLDK